MKEQDFKEKERISLLLFSSLYFQQRWSTAYIDSETFKSIFYIDNNNTKEIYFMKHSYSIDYYYDYVNYISFYDYYSNDYLIQYIVPKSLNYSILELINNTNFLFENDANKKNISMIYLSVPKFKLIN